MRGPVSDGTRMEYVYYDVEEDNKKEGLENIP